LPRGLLAMTIRPFPWETGTSATSRLAWAASFPSNLLLLFALAGTWLSRRRYKDLAFPVVFGCALLTMYALAEGNLGTAIRHREEATFMIAILAALAIDRLLNRVAAHRQASQKP
ncbi:MAG: hypothetical protein ACKVT0_08335, partial [Planctomycetaceae bacterium]